MPTVRDFIDNAKKLSPEKREGCLKALATLKDWDFFNEHFYKTTHLFDMKYALDCAGIELEFESPRVLESKRHGCCFKVVGCALFASTVPTVEEIKSEEDWVYVEDFYPDVVAEVNRFFGMNFAPNIEDPMFAS